MRSRKGMVLLVAVALTFIALAATEIEFQFHEPPRWGRVFLVTHRLSIIVNVLVFGLIFSLSYLILIIFPLSDEKRKNLLVSAASVIVLLLCLEFFLRLTGIMSSYNEKTRGFYMHPYSLSKKSAYHTHHPNQIIQVGGKLYSYQRVTNSLGLSFPEIPVSKQPGEIRIMALGDSFTEGDGAPADSTWMKAMERKMESHYPDVNFTFINAGVCGSDPVFEFRLFKDKLLVYQPDFVIAATNVSDIDDIMLKGGVERFVGDDECRFRAGPWWQDIYAFSHLFRLMIRLRLNEEFMTSREELEARNNAVSTISLTIDKFHQLAADNHARFIAVLMPISLDIKEDTFSLEPLEDSLKHADFGIVNLFDYYKNAGISGDNIDNYYWREGHHNSRGYEVFGEAVADYFISNELIKSENSGQ